jgi:thioester reductase-like protein
VALVDGDRVWAVIRGSAVNQDGRSNGLTAPRGPAQEAVIKRALAQAGVAGEKLGYVETHGTGTPLGDPIELAALSRALGRDPRQELLVGSVKTNIGHLEAAAGIAGLIKGALVAARAEVPPNLHMTEPNPRVPWDDIGLRVPTGVVPLQAERQLVGVSSFGFSGTNAHLVLEGAPAPVGAGAAGRERVVVKLAARGERALGQSAERLAGWLAEHPEAELGEVAWAAAVGRAELPERAALAAGSREELIAALEEVAGGGGRRGSAPLGSAPKSAFLLPGQGSRAAGAGAELYREEPAFARAIDRLAEVLGPLDRPPLSILLEDGEEARAALALTEHAQPALYALGVALGCWWETAGVRPDALAGHSVGAYGAAALAGVFSLEEGARLLAARGRLMGELPGEGAMAAVFCSERELREALAQIGAAGVELSALNSPAEAVIAGERKALEQALAGLASRGLRARRLDVSHAFHTGAVEPMLERFETELYAVQLRAPSRPLISDASGEEVGEEAAAPAYWLHHARSPTRFAAALRTLRALGCRQLIELGPAATLLGMAHATLGEEELELLPSLRPGQPGPRQLLGSAAQAWIGGARLDWAELSAPRPAAPASLPTYPFQRRRHWLPEEGEGGLDEGPRTVVTPLPQEITEARLSPRRHRYLAEHRVHGHVVVPGVAYLQLLLSGLEGGGGPRAAATQLTLLMPLIATPDRTHTLQAVIDPAQEDGARAGRLYSRSSGSDGAWTLHAMATIGAPEEPQGEPVPLDEIRSRLGDPLAGEDLYRRLWHPDFELGNSFRLLERVWSGDGEALGLVRAADPGSAAVREGIQPELLTLDACAQLLLAAVTAGRRPPPGSPVHLGTGFERFAVRPAEIRDAVWCWARLDGEGPGATGSLLVAGDDGARIAEVRGVSFRPVAAETLRRLVPAQPADAPPPDPDPGPGAPAAPGRSELRELDGGAREKIVVDFLKSSLARVLGMRPEELDPSQPITDVADSLMLVELKAEVEAELDVTVPLEVLFEAPTLAGFATWLSRALMGEEAPTGEPRPASMSVAEMSEAAALDPSIAPRSRDPAAAVPRAVLLTGATEYVGAFVLAALLARTEAKVHCLLDERDPQRALAAIAATLRRFDVEGWDGTRVVPVAGDLRRPWLSLGEGGATELAGRLDAIYHVASASQWAYSFQTLAPVNVDGTREILRLATAARPLPVHHFSTVGVFSSPDHGSGPVAESEPLEHSGPLPVPYAQTRWVAERMVRTAGERGLPVTVHRAAIGGAARTGAFDPSHHIPLALKACVETGSVPEWDAPIQIAPVDYVAGAIVELSLRPDLHGGTFHLVNPSGLTWKELAGRLRSFGYQLEGEPPQAWSERLTERFAVPGNGASGLLATLVESIERSQLPWFDCAQTLAALDGASPACPPLDELLNVYLPRMVGAGFLPPPRPGGGGAVPAAATDLNRAERTR